MVELKSDSNDPYQQIRELQSTVEDLKEQLKAKQQQLDRMEREVAMRESNIGVLRAYLAQLSRQKTGGVWESLRLVFRRQKS